MSGEAIVAKIDKLEEIPGADRIQVAYVLGERVIVSKAKQVGDIGILFPAETQLSEEYCHYNNLYRHSEKNSDPNQKGFFEDNRKVRAMKFLKTKSDAYFADCSSLDYVLRPHKVDLGVHINLGDKFKEIDGRKICDKFISPQSRSSIQNRAPKKKIETPLFNQHVDTEQFKYYADKIPVGSLLSFHAKVHGTSARYSHTLVKRPPKNLFERVLCNLGLRNTESWEYVAGTRRVVLWEDQREKEGFNGPEAWRFEWLDKLKPYLTRGMTVYGEIAGYANGSPIMAKHDVTTLGDKRYVEKYGKEIVYKYGCPEGTNRFIIYRITYTTADGNELDFTVDQIKHWCETRGFEYTQEIWPRFTLCHGQTEYLKDLVDQVTEQEGDLTECWYDASHIAEGIVIRIDHGGTTPMFLKNKSWAFKVCEGIANLETLDVEDAS